MLFFLCLLMAFLSFVLGSRTLMPSETEEKRNVFHKYLWFRRCNRLFFECFAEIYANSMQNHTSQSFAQFCIYINKSIHKEMSTQNLHLFHCNSHLCNKLDGNLKKIQTCHQDSTNHWFTRIWTWYPLLAQSSYARADQNPPLYVVFDVDKVTPVKDGTLHKYTAADTHVTAFVMKYTTILRHSSTGKNSSKNRYQA